jgi:RHS repeat-associated protein
LDNGRGKKLGIIKRLPDGYTSGGVNQPVEKDEFYYHGDHLGSSNMITDAYGAVYQHLEYFPYGETWIEEGGSYGGNTPGYKFTGKELDPETGLYYYRARYYDAVLSKWISADPLIERHLGAGGKEDDEQGRNILLNPLKFSLYAFVRNNPVVYADPDGWDWLKYTGQTLTWYAGEYGDTTKALHNYKATSGLLEIDKQGNVRDYQNAQYQGKRNAGPTPEGKYRVNLKPDANRTATADPSTGELVPNKEGGGIEKIPDTFTTSKGQTYTYPGWGKNRAYLEPQKGTNTKNRGSFYLHDSTKGFTHGCIETESGLFDQLKDYQKDNKSIDVMIDYPKGSSSTYGDTYQQ